jgi:HTH-type transcriptional regulator/antitoxin HipB
MAQKLNTKKSAISRIEKHAQDIRLSTLEKFAAVLGRKLEVSIQ